MSHEKILDRIRKLLNVANDERGNANECANAAAMAAKIMAKHNLEMVDVIAADLKNDDAFSDEFISDSSYDKKLPGWYNVLGTCVGQTLDCVCRQQWQIGPKGRKVGFQLLGYKEDVEVGRWLFNYILIQINKLASEAWNTRAVEIKLAKRRDPWASERRTFKDRYRYGVVLGITKRIRELYAREQEAKSEIRTSNGTSLVAIKQKRIEEVFNYTPEYQDIKNTSDHHAINMGYKDSSRIALNKVITEEEEAEKIGQVLQLEHKA